MKRDDPEGEDLVRVAVDPATGAFVGTLWFSHFFETAPSYATNGHLAWTGVAVTTPFRRRGVGRLLLQRIPDLARKYRITQLLSWVTEADGKAFLKAIGVRPAPYRRGNRLGPGRGDRPLGAGGGGGGAPRSPGARARGGRHRVPSDTTVAERH